MEERRRETGIGMKEGKEDRGLKERRRQRSSKRGEEKYYAQIEEKKLENKAGGAAKGQKE